MIRRHKTGPKQLRPCVVVVSEADTARVRRLIVRLGSIRVAKAALGLGDATFDAARDQGRMLRKTRDNLLEALDRVEAS